MEFLQLPWDPNFQRKEKVVDWQGMIDQTKNKINSWGIGWLNPDGKLTLINSILSAYPIYSCSISLAPKKIMKEFTREIRRFMWQGGKSDSSKKFHLVNLDTVCKPKIFGGAGICDPSKMNSALGAKVLW